MIERYKNQVYAGVLGKMIGVYMGRPVEGWAYDKINKELGEINYYIHREVGVPLVVADDDISGTFAFFRSLADNGYNPGLTAQDVGKTWLNYVIEDKTILWWGGIGRSTEQTAYFRLKKGTPAPDSGSIRLNGSTLAEQIGAQIFIDAFAMAAPGDPELATRLIREAARVSHDGIAVEAACYLGAMEAMAFDERDLGRLLDRGFAYAQSDALKRMVDEVRDICVRKPDWREARIEIDRTYGYDCYPGCCHVVPNHAMVIASLILGGDSFQRSIAIASSAAWDTDCNAGNVGCLNGIRLGLSGINQGADFRTPPADRLLVVSADGGSTISDAVLETRKILEATAALKQVSYTPEKKRFAFDFPGSVQGFAPCPYQPQLYPVVTLGSPAQPESGAGLELTFNLLAPGVKACVSTPVFIDFSELARNFSTLASPTLYATQTVRSRIDWQDDGDLSVRSYALYYDIDNNIQRVESDFTRLAPGENLLSWKVPENNGMSYFRLGFEFASPGLDQASAVLRWVDWTGSPEDFRQEGMLMNSIWNVNPYWLQSWVSSARYFAPDFKHTYCITHNEGYGLATLGTSDWQDYAISTQLVFSLHKAAGLVVRCKGHRRYYSAELSGHNTVSLIRRRDDDIKVLEETTYAYVEDCLYPVKLEVKGNRLTLMIHGEVILDAVDPEAAYVSGGAGFLISSGSVVARDFIVQAL